jgi:hypothetical protein
MEEIAEIAQVAETVVTSSNSTKQVVIVLGAAVTGYLAGTAVLYGIRKYRNRTEKD